MRRVDPLANPEALVRDLYAYVAYRVSNQSDAEEITSAVFERAVRYRRSYNPTKGSPMAWLVGIARTQISDRGEREANTQPLGEDALDGTDFEADLLERLSLREAVRALDARSRELVALRYGIGLPPREIAGLLGLEENAVNVALHRARRRLRAGIESGGR